MNLVGYYQIIFNMKQHHNWSVEEIENMYPWEREVYVALLKQYIEEENERTNKRMNQRAK